MAISRRPRRRQSGASVAVDRDDRVCWGARMRLPNAAIRGAARSAATRLTSSARPVRRSASASPRQLRTSSPRRSRRTPRRSARSPPSNIPSRPRGPKSGWPRRRLAWGGMTTRSRPRRGRDRRPSRCHWMTFCGARRSPKPKCTGRAVRSIARSVRRGRRSTRSTNCAKRLGPSLAARCHATRPPPSRCWRGCKRTPAMRPAPSTRQNGCGSTTCGRR